MFGSRNKTDFQKRYGGARARPSRSARTNLATLPEWPLQELRRRERIVSDFLSKYGSQIVGSEPDAYKVRIDQALVVRVYATDPSMQRGATLALPNAAAMPTPGPAAIARVLMPNFPQQAPALIVQTTVSLPRNAPAIVSHPLVGAQGVVENFQPVRSQSRVKPATGDLR